MANFPARIRKLQGFRTGVAIMRVLSWLMLAGDDLLAESGVKTPDFSVARGGFTGPSVPSLSPLLGEFVALEAGAIDGVNFPFFYPHWNLTDTTILRRQIETFRAWRDDRTQRGGLPGKIPLVLMVYAERHSESRDNPSPDYVQKCLRIGLESTTDHLTDGVVTYCLPKDNPSYVESMAQIYRNWPTNSAAKSNGETAQ